MFKSRRKVPLSPMGNMLQDLRSRIYKTPACERPRYSCVGQNGMKSSGENFALNLPGPSTEISFLVESSPAPLFTETVFPAVLPHCQCPQGGAGPINMSIRSITCGESDNPTTLLSDEESPNNSVFLSSCVIAVLMVMKRGAVENFMKSIESGDISKEEWWRIAVAVMYQQFDQQQPICFQKLCKMNCYAPIKEAMNNGSCLEEVRSLTRKIIWHPVKSEILNLCALNGGYVFACKHSVATIVYMEVFQQHTWRRQPPEAAVMTEAIAAINLLWVRTYDDKTVRVMWQCICAYMVVLHVEFQLKSMDDFFNSGRQEAALTMLSLSEWLKRDSNNDNVMTLVESLFSKARGDLTCVSRTYFP